MDLRELTRAELTARHVAISRRYLALLGAGKSRTAEARRLKALRARIEREMDSRDQQVER